MLATGVSRKIDELGRIVLPKELRNTLSVGVRDSLEFFTNGNQIVLKKYQPGCIFCGQLDGIEQFRGYQVCEECKMALVGMV